MGSVTRGSAKEIIIPVRPFLVAVECQVIGFTEFPGIAAGDGTAVVSGPPGVRPSDVACDAATVIPDQHIKFSGNKRGKDRPQNAFATSSTLQKNSSPPDRALSTTYENPPSFTARLPPSFFPLFSADFHRNPLSIKDFPPNLSAP